MQAVSIQPFGPDPSDDAERAAEQHTYDKAADGQLQRVGELGSDQLRHRLTAAEAVTKIATHGIEQETDILHRQRPVEAEPGARRVHGLVADRCSLQHQQHWVAGREPHGAEHDGPGDEERQDRAGQTCDDMVRAHRQALPLQIAASCIRSRPQDTVSGCIEDWSCSEVIARKHKDAGSPHKHEGADCAWSEGTAQYPANRTVRRRL